VWVTLQEMPANVGDFDRLIKYYNAESGFYLKYLEISTKAYFSTLPSVLKNEHIFKSLTVTISYIPLILLVVKRGGHLNKFMTTLGLLFFLDVGHALQFFRTYLALNIIIFASIYSSYLRSTLLILSTTVHQGIGLLFLSSSIITRLSMTGISIILIGLYFLTPAQILDHAIHSLWVIKTNTYYIRLHMMYLPIMLTILSLQFLTIIIWREVIPTIVFFIIVLSILLSLNGILSEALFRLNFYIVEIVFSLQFIFSKKMLKIG